jgi:hypothetical protein
VAAGIVVQGNFIGTDVTGKRDLGNESGVNIRGSNGNQIGGTVPGAGNVISGNEREGVSIIFDFVGTASENLVRGNLIGTDVTGTRAIRNEVGILIAGVRGNTIGGTSAAARNVISGNGTGMTLGGDAMANTVLGNYIGADVTGGAKLPNEFDGVRFFDASFNTIGGPSPGAPNVIAFNGPGPGGGNGIVVTGESVGNALLANSIFANSLLGIDLSGGFPGDGVTPNDPDDPDSGANDLQNFPVLTSAKSSGTETRIQGSLMSQPRTPYTFEFFSSPLCDPSGNGEGKTLLARTSVTTDYTGTASFDVTFGPLVPVGYRVTATATNPNGSTSEFSACRKVVAG